MNGSFGLAVLMTAVVLAPFAFVAGRRIGIRIGGRGFVNERHTCPRRLESYGVHADRENADEWRTGHGLGGQDDVGLSCSYCGSLNPDRFMQLVRDGWWVDPTDKAYKAYLAAPLTDDQVAAAREQWMAGPFVAGVRQAVCTDHAANVDAAVEHEWQQMPAASGHGKVAAKFYFQHLSEPQKDEFVELLNAKTVRIGYPGYFYVLPYFTQPAQRGVDG